MNLPLCARDETRTHTGFTPLAPETSASTISPPALGLDYKYTTFSENVRNCEKNIVRKNEKFFSATIYSAAVQTFVGSKLIVTSP